MQADAITTTLESMAYRADPLADATIAAILGTWDLPNADGAGGAEQWQPQWQKLAMVNRIISEWTTNQALVEWRAKPDLPPEIASALGNYVAAARELPVWADQQKIKAAETLFSEYGVLPVTLLFCASLPECYVLPDLSAVLQTTGQLISNADHRVRTTGAMVFPVMMRGGMTTPEGGGVAQIFKVRLIHATIRNLILRGAPEEIVTQMRAAMNLSDAHAGVIAPVATMQGTHDMQQTLFARGWNLAEEGTPCDQEELAYTLLTFSYVFLRSMRSLGIALSTADEEAYLHAWNVVGHMLGIERALMVDTVSEAEALFKEMQARGRADRARHLLKPDPRPLLGNALMGAMQTVIPSAVLKPFPVLLTRFLCGPETSEELGLNGRVAWFSKMLFAIIMIAIGLIDAVVRKFVPGFAFSRLLTRVLGYQLISRLLMDQTRPLKLPETLRSGMRATIGGWGNDAHAPAWVNRLERWFIGDINWKMHDAPMRAK